MTITNFLAAYPLTLSAIAIPRRSCVSHDPKWEADHWQLTISYPGTARKPFVCEYSTGIGHRKVQRHKGTVAPQPVAPSLESVLESLALDVSTGDQTFGDWCADLGYDEDSRRALDSYLACQQVTTGLRALLGGKGLDDLRLVEW